MSKDMNQIIKTEIESTEKESMYHKKTSRMLDAINPLCGSHTIPGAHSAPASGLAQCICWWITDMELGTYWDLQNI